MHRRRRFGRWYECRKINGGRRLQPLSWKLPLSGTCPHPTMQRGKGIGMVERKRISKGVRFEVFKRDAFSCQYCGATPPGAILHVDHITPVAGGGGNDIDNLITACSTCNLGKSATPLTSIPKSLREKAAEVSEREAQIRGYSEILEARRQRIEAEMWDVAAAIDGVEYVKEYNNRRLESIRIFLERMPFVDVIRAADIASTKFFNGEDRKFRYFCGICWSKIKEAEHG